MRVLSLFLLFILVGSIAPPSQQALAQQFSGAEAAAAHIQQTTGGQILSVRANPDPNNPGWLVKVLLTDGRVRTIFVP